MARKTERTKSIFPRMTVGVMGSSGGIIPSEVAKKAYKLGKETVTEAGKRIFEEVISVASGKVTKAEKLGQRDFCIFKMNVNI